MTRPAPGTLRGEVDLAFGQPLPVPWNAHKCHVWFQNGPAFTCRIIRYPDDLLRLETGKASVPVDTPVDTPVEIQWTQNRRGCYGAGIVATPPGSAPPGVYIRIINSIVGIERRLGVRQPVVIPVSLIGPAGMVLPGRSADLSLDGARIIVDPPRLEQPLPEALDIAGIVPGVRAGIVLALPTGEAGLNCGIATVHPGTGDIRIHLQHHNNQILEQIGALLRAEQHRGTTHLPPAAGAALLPGLPGADRIARDAE